MEANQELYELIDGYLMGSLSPEELSKFEERMSMDAALKKEVVLQKQINESILEKDVMDFRSTVKQALSEKPRQGVFKNYYYKIAASVSLLLVAGTFIYNAFLAKSSPDTLFEKYFMPYDNLISVRSNEAPGSDVSKAMADYDKAQYRKAINHFGGTDYKDSGLLSLYLGICYIHEGVLDSAQQALSIPISKPNSLYYYPGLYYQGLIHLREAEIVKAKSIFENLSQNAPNPYKDNSTDILENL